MDKFALVSLAVVIGALAILAWLACNTVKCPCGCDREDDTE